MKFSDLKFKAHGSLPEASIAKHTFANQWQISVVTGHEAFYISEEKPYEVAIFSPDGDYLFGDVFKYQDKEDINAMIKVLSKDDIKPEEVEKELTPYASAQNFMEKAFDAMESMSKMDTI